MKVFYHVDNDGKCAGFWVKKLAKHYDTYPLEFIKINYGMEFPFETINKGEQIFIVDYSILPEEMDKLLLITRDVTWIDHHGSAIERYKGYKNITLLKGLVINGIAGCMLTYCYLKHISDGGVAEYLREFDERMVEDAPMFTKYIADYDVWTFEYGEDTKRFGAAFELFDNEPTDDIWEELLEEDDLDDILEKGELIIKYQTKFNEEYCKNKGFDAMLGDYKCFAINLANVSSDHFKSIIEDEYDLFVGFSYDGKGWNYSLRSTKVDVSKIAMEYGGGGHAGAAGFNSLELVLKPIQNKEE